MGPREGSRDGRTELIDVADFEKDVLVASHTKPVLVDFWAPWCGPCRQLGPVLEKLAAEERAGFTLAKVNTDENQTVAAQFGIRGIPAVKLFVDGKVTDEFVGALPEREVRAWLRRALPSEAHRRYEAAHAALAAGHRNEAEALLEQALALEPGDAPASLLLAKLVLFKDPRRAGELAHARGVSSGDVEAIDALSALLVKGPPADLAEGAGRESYVAAVKALPRDLDGAMAALVDSVRRDRNYGDDLARRTLLMLFTVLGNEDELTRKHRRALEMALF